MTIQIIRRAFSELVGVVAAGAISSQLLAAAGPANQREPSLVLILGRVGAGGTHV
jgi:hypothetical protein